MRLPSLPLHRHRLACCAPPVAKMGAGLRSVNKIDPRALTGLM